MPRAVVKGILHVVAPAVAWTFAWAGVVHAQAAADPTVRVFLECTAAGCDDDYLRTELTFVRLVRDRLLADVHVLVTALESPDAGRTYTVYLAGRGRAAAMADTVTAVARATDAHVETRAALARAVKLGLVRYVRHTPEGARLEITHRAAASTAAPPPADRWGGWIYRVSGAASMDGDDNYTARSLTASSAASRVTAAHKVLLSVRVNHAASTVQLGDGRSARTHQRSHEGRLVAVRGLGPHWSAGVVTDVRSSAFENVAHAVRAMPAIEYDLFPYAEATRRQLVARYAVGARRMAYEVPTVFGRLRETRPVHELKVATEARQGWGSLSGGGTWSQYLHDRALRRLTLDGTIEWRLTAGLSVHAYASYARLRDQLNVPAAGLTDAERLLRLRELQTGRSYASGAGLSYTFGSAFTGAVNPRFGI